jgi:predicted deacylase
VEALIEGCLNVIGALQMIARDVTPVAHPVWIGNDVRVRADGPGMFFQTVEHGAYVMAGATVGYTTDYLGRSTGDVKAPLSGIVTFIRGVPSLWKGAAVVNVGMVFSEPPPYKKPAP